MNTTIDKSEAKTLNKVVRLGTVPLYGAAHTRMNVFCKIEIESGKLSISGVEGPTSNGNCHGSCGQIDMHLRSEQKSIEPAPGWDHETLRRFFDVWEEWHLNDLTPNCEHQCGPAWTSKDVTLYHFRLTNETSKLQREAKEAALAALKSGEPFQATEEQQLLASLEHMITYHEPTLPAKLGLYYSPSTPLFTGDKGQSEIKKTGWLNEREHPEGFLSKACPVCGYKYGSSWRKRELPQDVIEFLSSLPDADIKPAWV